VFFHFASAEDNSVIPIEGGPMLLNPKLGCDIEDVMREEKSRGKRLVDTKALRRKQELLRKVREALKLRTEREFVEAIRELKFVDDPEKLRELLKIWRASFSVRQASIQTPESSALVPRQDRISSAPLRAA
jgi:hypothetical protein